MLHKKIFCPKCLLPERDIAFKDDLTDFYNHVLENMHKEKKKRKKIFFLLRHIKNYTKIKKYQCFIFRNVKKKTQKNITKFYFEKFYLFFSMMT